MSNRVDLTSLDESDVERMEAFLTTKLGPPQEAVMPVGWDTLSFFNRLPEKAPYYVEVLQGGMAIGRGWKVLKETFESDLLARMRAYDRTHALGQPSRVVLATRKGFGAKILTICVFYKKFDKIYVAFQPEGDGYIEQEVFDQFDEAGGEITEEKVPDESCVQEEGPPKWLEHPA